MTSPIISKHFHQRIRRFFGPASDYQCRDCDNRGQDWAYQYTDPNPLIDPGDGGVYSLDASNYEPMCKKCHRAFDMKMDGRIIVSLRKNVKAAQKALREAREDPVRGPVLSEISRKNVLKAIEASQEVNTLEQMRERGHLGGTARSKNMKEDPDLRERMVSVATSTIRAANKVRRKCSECGRIMRPASMGNHQKHSGHTGWTGTGRSEHGYTGD